MKEKSFDVIVIGVGAMGAATCWRLASRGARVLGLDRHGIPNAMGSSHGASRAIRLCYYEHPAYVPLLKHAYADWAALERDAGVQLLAPTGGLYMGKPDREFINGAVVSAREHDLAHEMLDHAELARRYPQFHLPEDYVGMFEPTAGILLPEQCIAACASLAVRHGAVLHADEPVEAWRADDAGVFVTTDRASYRAERLVLCAGAWTGPLLSQLEGLDVSLRVSRQVMGWVSTRTPDAFSLGTLPVWAIEHDDDIVHYGFPIGADSPGMKLANLLRNSPCTADSIDRTITEEDKRDLLDMLERFMPEAAGPFLDLRACLYTNSADSHFIVDTAPGSPRVVIACGFSGHGFKFASVMGRILSDLALDNRCDLPIEFLSLDRFGRS